MFKLRDFIKAAVGQLHPGEHVTAAPAQGGLNPPIEHGAPLHGTALRATVDLSPPVPLTGHTSYSTGAPQAAAAAHRTQYPADVQAHIDARHSGR